ncbi:MAG: parvulin-like peptidyl-prolyl isomerase [Planctomycetota bacterium]|jgi:parvulin-like peptidyl-prolyl isomerase
MRHLKAIILLLCLTLVAAVVVNAVSIRSLLGLDEEESKTEEVSSNKQKTQSAVPPDEDTSPNWAKSNGSANANEIDIALIKQLLVNLEPSQSSALLADKDAFTQFLRQEANNVSVISAARSNKVDEDANTAFLMQRGAENILREVYLKKLIDAKLPKDFPGDQQVQEYYDKNQDKFVIAKRVHVWQIFFPVTGDMNETAVSELRKKANNFAEDIRKKKIDFNSAAITHSKHSPSNANGGYMGLLKTAELLPDLQKSILDLAEGNVSQALTTNTGIHIVKRGAIVPERKVTLEEGKEQIRKLLISQVRTQLRQAIFEQAAKTYPVDLSDNKIEEWRLRLKTNL